MNLGVLDIGTTSVHMMVVRIDADLKVHVIDRAKELVHLGRGVFETGRLEDEAQERAFASILQFRRLAERRGVERYIAVATSAVREARNGGAFLQRIYESTGIHARIISGHEEARLIYRGVIANIDDVEGPFLVLDLGGGSLEIAYGSSKNVQWTTSLPFGVRRLVPEMLKDGEPDPTAVAAVRARLKAAVTPWFQKAKKAGFNRCFVSGGSAGALLKLLVERDEAKPGKMQLEAKPLAKLEKEILELSKSKRKELKGLDPQRVDLIVPAATAFATITEALDSEDVYVSDAGLREGLAADFLDRHGDDVQFDLLEPNVRRRAVLKLAERYRYDASHAHQVAKLAIELFDATRELHGLKEDMRELLEYGALLHDVGYIINEQKHHKHSEYLILNGLIEGFRSDEIRIIAALARYHRKTGPKLTHANWRKIDVRLRPKVKGAAAILRIADGLDRGHARAVQSLRIVRDNGRISILVRAKESTDLEMWAATKKSDLFHDAFGLTIELRRERGGKQ